MINPMNFFKIEGLSCIGQLTLFDEPIALTNPCSADNRFIEKGIENDEDVIYGNTTIYVRDVLEGTYLLAVKKEGAYVTECALVHESADEYYEGGMEMSTDSNFIGCYPISKFQLSTEDNPYWLATLFEDFSEDHFISSEGITLPMNARFIRADVFYDEDEKFIGFHLKSRD